MNIFNHTAGASLDIDGAEIYYEVIGHKIHPPLLVLPGGFGSIEDFNGFLPGLTGKFRVIGIDSRGQGRSTLGKEALTYERIQKDAQRVLEHLGIEVVSVLGFSDGGVVAYRLTALTPVKVKKLVTIGARWHLKNTEPARELLSRVTGASWRAQFPAQYEDYQRLNPEPDFERLARSLVRMWLDPGPSGYPNEEVSRIDCPVLISRGEQDPLISRRDVVELAQLMADGRLFNVPRAGHMLFVEQRDKFLKCLNAFLAE